MSKNELIAKLEEISALYANIEAIRVEMNDFISEDHYDRQIVVPPFPGEYKSEKERKAWQNRINHDKDNAVKMMGAAYEKAFAPKKPVKPNIGKRPEPEPALVNELKKKQGWIPLVAGGVAACALLSGGLFYGETDTFIGIIVILLACAAAGLFYYTKLRRAKEADKEVADIMIRTYEENKVEAEEKYARDMETYTAGQTAYLLSKSNFLEEYTAWRDVYRTHLREEEEIEEKLEADRVAGVNRIYEKQYVPAQKKLEESNDLIAAEYLPVLHIIIELIKSGRADDLKEAVNLYEELVYRERQLKLQREQEERRRYEEEQRRQDEERRYQQQMQQRREEERQRRYEEQRRREDEERRHREDMALRERQERDRQYEERRRIEEDRRRADKAELERKRREERDTMDQCNRCALNGRCSMSFRRPNCASYRPR